MKNNVLKKILPVLTLFLLFTVSLRAHAAQWRYTGSLQAPSGYHAATLLPNGKVLVTGGYYDIGGYLWNLNAAQLFNPNTETWTSAPGSSTARAFHTATLLQDGKVLIVGGQNDIDGALSAAQLYDSVSGAWSTTGSLSTPRILHTATLLQDGTVVVVGGIGSGGAKSSVEIYNPSTGTWSSGSSLNVGRYRHTATLLQDGRVLVIGGSSNSGVLSSAEIYDPSNPSAGWTLLSGTGSLTDPRECHTATLLTDGKVLVVGGIGISPDGDTINYLRSTELFNPTTGTWTSVGLLNGGRGNHTATLLTDGKVLAAAGEDYDTGPIKTTELYDPATQTWATATPLHVSRDMATATLLHNGKVLVAGGFGDEAGYTDTVEITSAAIRPGFNTYVMHGDPSDEDGGTGANGDDGSTAQITLGFPVNFFCNTYNSLYVNMNGNVTFANPLSTYTPISLQNIGAPVIAPFWADVDTRAIASGKATYGFGSVDGHAAFGVTWNGVGYFSQKTDKLNTFQMIIISRPDLGTGKFDLEFNYDQVLWEAGDASSGVDGLGGDSARAGFSDGDLHTFEFGGSGENGAFLDSNLTTGLIYNSLNSVQQGRYYFPASRFVCPPTFGDAGVGKAVGNHYQIWAETTTGSYAVQDAHGNIVYGQRLSGGAIDIASEITDSEYVLFWSCVANGDPTPAGEIIAVNCSGDYNNDLTALDVSHCAALQALECFGQNIASLDLHGLTQLSFLAAHDGGFQNINLSGCTALTEIDCSYNPLNSVTLTGCTALQTVNVGQSTLPAIDLTDCTAITTLRVSDTGLTDNLGLSQCSALRELYCSGTGISFLDVRNLIHLETFDASYCPGLYVVLADGCTALTSFSLNEDGITHPLDFSVSGCSQFTATTLTLGAFYQMLPIINHDYAHQVWVGDDAGATTPGLGQVLDDAGWSVGYDYYHL